MADFHGRRIWLTRPKYQAEQLQQMLQQQGAQVIQLPMFEITPLEYSQATKNIVLQLDQYELVFFISTNAARLGLDCFYHFWAQLPVGQHYFAVGPTTAQVLEQEGLVVHYPKSRMSTEALLELPELSDIAGSKALVCRGVGGRQLLADALQNRGVEVTGLELYQRQVPEYSEAELEQLTASQIPDAIVVTSSEAVQNLGDILGNRWPRLYSCQLLVSSQRIAEDARQAGFTEVFIMKGASDTCIIEGLETRLSSD